MSKMKLSSRDRLDWIDVMTNYIDLVYAKTKIELPGHIWPSVICEGNQMRKWHDRLYKCGLRQKQNWVAVIYRIESSLWRKLNRTTTWSIIKIWSMPKSKLTYQYRFDRMRSVMKTKQGNDVTHRTCTVWAENEIQLSWPIGSGAIYYEN